MASLSSTEVYPAFDDRTHEFPPSLNQPLSTIVLWSLDGRVQHWFTTCKFANFVKDGKKRYGGISLNMSLPEKHEHEGKSVIFKSPPGIRVSQPPSSNLFGSLAIAPRLHNALFSRHATTAYELHLKNGVTGRAILDLIKMRQLQLYQFSPRSSGCLYWQLTFLEELVNQGWVERRELASIYRKIDVGDKKVPFPPVAGCFYQLPEVAARTSNDQSRTRIGHPA